MKSSLLRWLCCPFCGGDFNASEIDPTMGELGYGILTCFCDRYPVVAGIPILKKDSPRTLGRVIALIEAGRNREALFTMLSPASPTLAPALMGSLPSAIGFRRLKRLAHWMALRGWREQAATLLMDQGDQVTARHLLNFCFPRNRENFNYFYFRFGQPRHLVALSFVSLIQRAQKPILDLACGCGHITHGLVQRAKDQPVIGVDSFFFGLYIAKHWIAPEAAYVCCTADTSLPFPAGAFSVVFCSDAFHYFLNKTTSIRELKRLTQNDGLIMLVRVHNGLLRRPHAGLPLPPAGYQALVADMPHRLVPDSDVLFRYLQKQGPSLAHSGDIGSLSHEPVLSVVASHCQKVFQDYGAFEHWPHAEGHLGLNPLYVVEEQDELRNMQLRLNFPSAQYKEDHKEYKNYLPETVKMPSNVLTNLTIGKQIPEMDRFIEQFVVLGMPRRYSYEGTHFATSR